MRSAAPFEVAEETPTRREVQLQLRARTSDGRVIPVRVVGHFDATQLGPELLDATWELEVDPEAAMNAGLIPTAEPSTPGTWGRFFTGALQNVNDVADGLPMRRLTLWELDHHAGLFTDGLFTEAVEAGVVWRGRRLFRTIMDPAPSRSSRREILQLLNEGPQLVTAVAELLDVYAGSALKHLHELEAAGYLEAEVLEGSSHPYLFRVADPEMVEAELQALDPTWKHARGESEEDGGFIQEREGGRPIVDELSRLTMADVASWRGIMDAVWDGALWVPLGDNEGPPPTCRAEVPVVRRLRVH